MGDPSSWPAGGPCALSWGVDRRSAYIAHYDHRSAIIEYRPSIPHIEGGQGQERPPVARMARSNTFPIRPLIRALTGPYEQAPTGQPIEGPSYHSEGGRSEIADRPYMAPAGLFDVI